MAEKDIIDMNITLKDELEKESKDRTQQKLWISLIITLFLILAVSVASPAILRFASVKENPQDNITNDYPTIPNEDILELDRNDESTPVKVPGIEQEPIPAVIDADNSSQDSQTIKAAACKQVIDAAIQRNLFRVEQFKETVKEWMDLNKGRLDSTLAVESMNRYIDYFNQQYEENVMTSDRSYKMVCLEEGSIRELLPKEDSSLWYTTT